MEITIYIQARNIDKFKDGFNKEHGITYKYQSDHLNTRTNSHQVKITLDLNQYLIFSGNYNSRLQTV